MTEITEQISLEHHELDDFDVSQTILCKADYLHYIYRSKFSVRKPKNFELFKTYARPLIYYPNTEEVNVVEKCKKIAEITHDSDNVKISDQYTDDLAESQYLASNPVSFLIIGKPDIEQKEIAQILSENWKCINITPESVLNDEILSDTRAGKCIKYNLEAGRSIGPEIILRLVEKRLQTKTAKHRGYVLSGFPLLKNELYKEDPISSESAVFTVQEIFEELLPDEKTPERPGSVSLVKESEASSVTPTENEEEEEELEGQVAEKEMKKQKSEIRLSKDIDVGSLELPIVTRTKAFYALADPNKQITFLKNLLGKPLVIIYVMCGTNDVITKRENSRYNIYSQSDVFLIPKVETDNVSANQSATTIDNDNLPELYKIDGNLMKSHVKLPMNFRNNIIAQIVEYKHRVQENVEKMIIKNNSQYFIKVDGRLSALNMYQTIAQRLKTLAFQPVLIPELIAEEELVGEMDDENAEIEPEIAYKKLRSRGIVGPQFKLQLSNWGFMCPVVLKEGRFAKGKTEFAVKFMNKIFFLSSKNALIKFYRNPRPYLTPIMPKATGRFWVFGPRVSKKSAVSRCLSLLHNCKILVPEELERKYLERKEIEYLDKLRTALITEAISIANEKKAKERAHEIDHWKKLNLSLLRGIVSRSTESMTDSEKLKLSDDLNNNNLPNLDEKNLIEEIVHNPELIEKYLPDHLKHPVDTATVFSDFVFNYVKEAISKAKIPEMRLTLEERIDMYRSAIQNTEDDNYDVFQKRGGWIIDGMPLDLEIIMALYPDYVADDIICLYEENSEHTFLIERFAKKDFSVFVDYKTLFEELNIESTLNAEILFTSPVQSKTNFIDTILNDILDEVYVESEPFVTKRDLEIENLIQYRIHLDEYNNFLQNLRLFFKEKHFPPLYFSVDGKHITTLLKEIVLRLENKYRKVAHVMNAEDRAEELADFGEPMEMTFAEDNETENIVDSFEENRRLGSTNYYCPVTFERYFVLWRGKHDLSVSFEQNVYLLSSEENLKEFAEHPRNFIKNSAPKKFPPPRICIIGDTGSGKSTIGVNLAENYGLHYINFDYLLLSALNIPGHHINDVLKVTPTAANTLLNHMHDLNAIQYYLNDGEPMNFKIVKKLLRSLWFDEPYVDAGFVLDDFPRRPSDIAFMVENYLIPDVVINLHCNQSDARDRLYKSRFNLYRDEVMEQHRLKELEFEATYKKWQEERLHNLRQLAEQKREERKILAMEQSVEGSKLLPTPVDSSELINKTEHKPVNEIDDFDEEWFVYDEIMEMEDLEEINHILDNEMPEPIFNEKIESEDDTALRVSINIDKDYEQESLYIGAVDHKLLSNNIQSSIISTVNKTEDKVLYEVMRLTDKLKFRNDSIFERTYETQMYIAERLLEHGYYFMSKFGRTCPVQIYEKINPIQMFIPGETKSNVFPIIWKRYIYFIYGEESKRKFRENPLIYIYNEEYKFPLIPVVVAIIGPPKSGKTTLAKRFAKDFEMKIISRGSAIRYNQKQVPYSDVAKNINNVLDKGLSTTYEMTARAVESLTLDSLSLCQGYVLDGFPNTKEEMKHLIHLGIVPHIFIDVRVTLNKMKEYASVPLNKNPLPNYSIDFIKCVYDNWKRNANNFREWLFKEYQNIYIIRNVDSKWRFWTQAKKITFVVMKRFHNFLRDKEYDKVLHMAGLCVTPIEFSLQQSVFRSYCPLCLFYETHLNDGGKAPNRNCVYRYRHQYFFVCKEHSTKFVEKAIVYLPPINDKVLPDDLPKIIYEESINYAYIYEDGFCIVCFWDNQPRYILKKGTTKYVVAYKEYYYLFCSDECLKKFMISPFIYYNKVINFKNHKPLNLRDFRNLPTLGYLEQFAAKLIIDAVIEAEIVRPYFPFLNVAQSAAIHMAVYLKCHNSKSSKETRQLYQKTRLNLADRREKLTTYIKYFKSRLNPYVFFKELGSDNKILAENEEPTIFEIDKWLLQQQESYDAGEYEDIPYSDA